MSNAINTNTDAIVVADELSSAETTDMKDMLAIMRITAIAIT